MEAVGRKSSHRRGNPATLGVVRWTSAGDTVGYRLRRPKGKVKGSPYLITERRVPEMIPVLGSLPAGDVSHKLGGRLPLLSAKPAFTPANPKRAATNFAAW